MMTGTRDIECFLGIPKEIEMKNTNFAIEEATLLFLANDMITYMENLRDWNEKTHRTMKEISKMN